MQLQVFQHISVRIPDLEIAEQFLTQLDLDLDFDWAFQHSFPISSCQQT